MSSSVAPSRGRSASAAWGTALGAMRSVEPVRSAFDRTSGRRRVAWLGVDAAALLALCALVGVAHLPTFGSGWLWVSVLGGGVVGLLIGWASWRLRLNTAATTVMLGVAWFVLGGFLAMPSASMGRVLPTTRALRGLATAPITGWRDVITLDPPIGETGNLLCIPLLLALLTALGGALISLRSRRPTAAWLPGVAAVLMSFALGVNDSWRPWPTAIASVVLVLLWTSHRRASLRNQLVASGARTGWVGLALGAGMVVLAVALTSLAVPLVTPGSARAALRHAVAQPLQVNRYPSPLQGFRANYSEHRDDTMFTVTGLAPGTVMPVAVLDSWDGLTYTVVNSQASPAIAASEGQYRRVGSRIAVPSDRAGGTPFEATVTIANPITGVWVPTVGQLTRVRFSGPRHTALADQFFYNRLTGTAVDTAGLAEGDAYRLSGLLTSDPGDAAIRAADADPVALPDPPQGMVPEAVTALAARWSAHDATAGAKVADVAKHLHDEGYLSHGVGRDTPSAPGHTSARITDLLADPTQMVGDDEQYAVAMALMARSLGVSARVVYGYRVTDSGTVTGNDVVAEAEVHLTGLGWVALHATPERTLRKPKVPTPPNTRPPVDTPLPPPKKPQAPPAETQQAADRSNPPAPHTQIDWPAVARWTAITGIPLVTVVLPLAVVVIAKRRRRQGRRSAPVVANRYAGAWAEVVDRARDLGRSPSPSATRSEQAEALGAAFPGMGERADPIGVARQADAQVFSPDQGSDESASEYWQRTDDLVQGMRASVRPWRWLLSLVSTRSLRRYR